MFLFVYRPTVLLWTILVDRPYRSTRLIVASYSFLQLVSFFLDQLVSVMYWFFVLIVTELWYLVYPIVLGIMCVLSACHSAQTMVAVLVNSVLFFFLSLNLLIGWQLSIWICCRPFSSLLDNYQFLCFWRLALSFVVEAVPRPFFRILLLEECLLQTGYV